ncbi:MAG TPA: ABC transporter permease [Pyrinomonadaceae bacterium]|nr:ABC transporter permease [Pyrinomonadaceae bacterium]
MSQLAKFRAVVKREYVQRVRSRMFVIVTVGAPLMFALFTVVPILIAGIKAGGPTRVAVVDETGRMYARVRDSLGNAPAGRDDEGDDEGAPEAAQGAMNQNSRERVGQMGKAAAQSFEVEEVSKEGRALGEVKAQLDERVRRDELNGYLILPQNVLDGGEAEYHTRNVGDVFTMSQVRSALTRAVRDARLDARGVGPEVMRAVNQPVNMKTTKAGGGGGEADRGQGFFLVFGVGFVIYLTILMYGQVVLGAVIEEKETRIAEILFSSIRPFTLMSGKLVGVSLVALSQFAIWGLAFVGLGAYFAERGASVAIPQVSAGVYAYVVLFFLMGYFIYSTLYALVGSMVTTSQEGGQLSMPIILLLVVGFYLAFPVIRSPNSSFAVWVSLVPFFAPITMLIRIVAAEPPAWQVALSLALGFATVAVMLWLAGRVYRVGMLMYGKRATIPEMLKWIRQP